LIELASVDVSGANKSPQAPQTCGISDPGDILKLI
jgi:hypothetical protein